MKSKWLLSLWDSPKCSLVFYWGWEWGFKLLRKICASCTISAKKYIDFTCVISLEPIHCILRINKQTKKSPRQDTLHTQVIAILVLTSGPSVTTDTAGTKLRTRAQNTTIDNIPTTRHSLPAPRYSLYYSSSQSELPSHINLFSIKLRISTS